MGRRGLQGLGGERWEAVILPFFDGLRLLHFSLFFPLSQNIQSIDQTAG